MPILNLRVETKKKGKNTPAPAGLREAGPLMQVRLTVPDALAESYQKQGKSVPSVDGHVLIDTGAMSTAVDIAVAQQIGLPVIGRARVSSASQTDIQVPVFSGKLSIPGFTTINIPKGLIGVNLSSHRLPTIALIGRDLLEAAVLVYNGPEGTVSLSI